MIWALSSAIKPPIHLASIPSGDKPSNVQTLRKRRQKAIALFEQGERQADATAHGYSSDLRTLPRVARVIESTTAVRYHPGHVWRILRRMGSNQGAG